MLIKKNLRCQKFEDVKYYMMYKDLRDDNVIDKELPSV